MRRGIFALAFVAIAALAGATPGFAEDVVKVAVAQRGAWDTGLAELGKRGGVFKKHGIDLQILYAQAGPEAIQALIAGSVDIATGSGITAAIGTISKGAPVRIIGAEILGAPDQYWYVPADSPVRGIQDFNGRTVSFSLPGSSSNAALLALIAQYKLQAKPVSTGSIVGTLTQVLTHQVDVGFSAVPFFLDKVEAGQIRIVATGDDVAILKTRTGRVNLANLNMIENRADVLRRFHAAYKDTIEWMYSDPEALRAFSEFAELPLSVLGQVRKMIPKEAMNPDRIVGVDQVIAEAVAGKFITAAVTPDDVMKMLRIPAN